MNDKKKNVRVIISRCPQNHNCPSIAVCPVGALVQIGYFAPSIDSAKCVGCGNCVLFCPREALIAD
jgi:Fe-S-cluster-containing hydrogenase component 2